MDQVCIQVRAYVLAGIGALAAFGALHELGRSLPRLTHALAVFFWVSAALVLAGWPLQKHFAHHWPISELAMGAILSVFYCLRYVWMPKNQKL